MLRMYFLVFFFFKQKTAYEIMPSLVGSEMCIRDRILIKIPPATGPSGNHPQTKVMRNTSCWDGRIRPSSVGEAKHPLHTHPSWTIMNHVATGASPVPPKRSKAEPPQPPNSYHSANPTILVIPTRREAPRRNLLPR